MSFSNPDGDITNFELELCGSIAMNDVASQTFDTREQTLHTLCDNTPAVACQQKGSTSTTKAASYLLRVQAFHQRVYRYCPRISHIPGNQNGMADDCSRLWHLSDTALLAHFDSTYPQKHSWQLCHLRKPMLSVLISSLLRQSIKPPLLHHALLAPAAPGRSGKSSAPISTKTLGSTTSPTRSSSLLTSHTTVSIQNMIIFKVPKT